MEVDSNRLERETKPFKGHFDKDGNMVGYSRETVTRVPIRFGGRKLGFEQASIATVGSTGDSEVDLDEATVNRLKDPTDTLSAKDIKLDKKGQLLTE